MKILIIPSEEFVPAHAPLLGIFQKDQAKILREAGHRVAVLSPPQLVSLKFLGSRLAAFERGIYRETVAGVPVWRHDGFQIFPKSGMAQIWWWGVVAQCMLRRIVNEAGWPEVIHAHNALYAGLLARRIRQKWGIPYVLTENSSQIARGILSANEKKGARLAYEAASKVLFVSSALGAAAEKHVGNTCHPWAVIPNVISEEFQGLQANWAARTEGEPFTFLNVGSLIEVKNQELLLRAFAHAISKNVNLRLKIVGEGPLRPSLQDLAGELGVGNLVSFMGQLDRQRIIVELLRAQAYVHASKWETFGVALIEALACGRPVVSTMCGGPEEIVREGNGLLAAQEPEALGEALLQMQRNYSRHSPVDIRKDCLERFGKASIVNQLEKVYKEVLGKRNA